MHTTTTIVAEETSPSSLDSEIVLLLQLYREFKDELGAKFNTSIIMQPAEEKHLEQNRRQVE